MPVPRVLPHPSSAVHRAWRAILVICCSIPLVTCSEDTPVGPHGFGFGTVRVTPAFNANASLVPLTLDQVQVIVVRPAAETLKVVNQSFDQDSTQVHVQVSDIQLRGTSEDLDVTIRLLAGPTLLFSGTQTVHVTSGAAPPPTSIPVVYEGPGANVAAIQIGPRDSTLLLGASFSYRATATDSQSAPVTQFYVSWGSSAGKINAAGTFTAPSQRGKIVIRAATPSGAKDSTTVSITAPAASLAKSGGDAQSALAGSRLPQLLAVEVVGSDGLPVSGVAVGFATTSGGSVDSATAKSDSLGIARTGAVLGLVPGPQTFTASATGLASVTFNETATAGLTRTWTGAVSTDWSTAGNWNPSAIPDNTVDVVIPSGLSRYPTLTAAGSAKTVTVNTGATLGLGALNLQVGGNVFADGAITGGGAVQIAASAQVRGSISNLILSGAVAASGALTVSSNITVTGATGNFLVNSQTVTVGGAVTTQGGGLLTMTNALDQLSITGDAAFGGGAETGLLTAGVLRIGGNFSQTVTGTSFAASGTHLTTFTGTGAHTVSFANPTTSQFQGLDLSQATGGVTLLSDAKAAGQLTSTPASGTPLVTTTATPRVFTVGGVNVTGLRVDKMELVIGSGTVGSFNNVQFTNSPTTSPQLAISNPGAATAYTFINVSFATTPTAPNGFYISATDVNTGDGLPLVINMIAPTPAAPGAFVSTAGGATVNWPGGIIWTGAVSSNWSTAGNWSSGTVPTAADNVTIPSGTPNSPVLTAASAVNGVTVLAGGSLNLGGFTLTTNGNVLVSSPITNGTLAMAGAGQLSGSVPTLNVNAAVTAIGNVTVTGTLTISGATAGYTVGGHTTTVTGSIQTASGGTLTMTNAADSVIVINSVSMNGGATTGLLTNGVMIVEGNFTQLGAATFAASGSHKTVLSWSGLGAVPIVSFADPVNSHFQDLDATLANRDSLLTNVSVLGRLISTPSATPSTFKSVAGAAVSAAGVDVTGLTLDGVTLSIGSGAITAFSGVTFQNQSATATQLTVNNPGQAAAFTFTNLKFLTAPSTGLYLKATDADGATPNVLVINMVNASPYQGGAFFQVANGAIVNWPPAPVWVGTADNNWSNASNWSFGAVPQATDSVVIGPATNQPSLSQNVSVAAVNVTSGTLTLNTHSLTVARTFAPTGSGTLKMVNTADTLT
ncbi:MAG TPA: hypothetical protein VMG41_08200, partial [Gemmatimonadales bacterium]|nr:hypothetical protein [Gemmatimonadales bacterium]